MLPLVSQVRGRDCAGLVAHLVSTDKLLITTLLTKGLLSLEGGTSLTLWGCLSLTLWRLALFALWRGLTLWRGFALWGGLTLARYTSLTPFGTGLKPFKVSLIILLHGNKLSVRNLFTSISPGALTVGKSTAGY